MKKLIILFVTIIISNCVNSQTIKWVKELKATHAGSGGQIITDLQGNSYGVGGYTGTLTLAPTISIQQNSAYLPGYTCGIDTSNGNATWVSEIKPVGGCGCGYGDQGSAFEFDHSGNFLVAGYFCNCGIMAFGTQTLSSISHQTYLAKYSKTGQLLWVKTKADVNDGYGTYKIIALTTDEFDNVYLSINSNLVTNFAGLSIGKGTYLIKINSNGNGVWAKQTWDFINSPNDGLFTNNLQYLKNKLYIYHDLKVILPTMQILFQL